jgi:fructan beta-fructosidase
VGEFDGTQFINQSGIDLPLWIDYGKDNYAGVTWSDVPKSDGRRIFIGWMSNWQYANQVPTERWRNAMTLPRELSLFEQGGRYRLRSRPVVETELLRESGQPVVSGGIDAGIDLIPPAETGDPLLELDLKIEPASGTGWKGTGAFGILLCNQDDSLRVTIHPAMAQVTIERPGTGPDLFSADFPGVHTAPFPEVSGSIRLHAFIDRSSIELFINGGECVMTELFFPSKPYQRVILFSEDQSVKLAEGKVYHLLSIWSDSLLSVR